MAGMIKTDVVGLKALYDTFKDDVQRADDIQKLTDTALITPSGRVPTPPLSVKPGLSSSRSSSPSSIPSPPT